jgi:hypothetical protein
MAQATFLAMLGFVSILLPGIAHASDPAQSGWVDGRVTWFDVQNGDLTT